MQYIQATIYLMLTSCFMMTSVQAHDPSEHVKTNEAPKCESMKAMDHSKMDANDPIMMAMMQKCKAQAEKEAMQMDHSNMEMDHSNMDHSSMEGMSKSAAGGHHKHN